jgi:small subunit ribosomal protein S2
MRQLLQAGIHFGHNTSRWNPKMRPYIFGVRNDVHIIDLEQTVPLFQQAMQALRDTVAGGGRILFVGTKRQAQDKVREAAEKSGQYFVNSRWLGGMLTNWQTISYSINRLKELEEFLAQEDTGMTKKENLMLSRERDKLDRDIGGIKNMGGLPDMLFIIDTNKEELAVKEANKLGIPVVAVIDSNSNPDGIDYPIPGNDDAIRSINCYLDMANAAILEGIQAELAASSEDSGTAEEVNVQVPETDESAQKDDNDAAAAESREQTAADDTGYTGKEADSSTSESAGEADSGETSVAAAEEATARASNG